MKWFPKRCLLWQSTFGVGSGWYSLKPKGHIEVFGIKRFGVSGSGSDVAKHLGFTVEALTQRMLDMINN